MKKGHLEMNKVNILRQYFFFYHRHLVMNSMRGNVFKDAVISKISVLAHGHMTPKSFVYLYQAFHNMMHDL